MRRMLLACCAVLVAAGLLAGPASADDSPPEGTCLRQPWPADDPGCDVFSHAPYSELEPQVAEVGKPFDFRPSWSGDYDHLVWRIQVPPESGLTTDPVTGEIAGTLKPGWGADLDYRTVSAVTAGGKTVHNLVFRFLQADPHIVAATEEFGDRPREGARLTAQLRGVVYPLPAWAWSRGPAAEGPFTPIEGATDPTYTPTAADVGSYLRVDWTVHDVMHVGLATSNPVAPRAPIDGLAPTVAGSLRTDGVLHLDPGEHLSPGVSLECTWYADGGVRQTGCGDLALANGDAGRRISVSVGASGPGYLAASKVTPATSSIVSARTPTPPEVVYPYHGRPRLLLVIARHFTSGTTFAVHLAGRRIARGPVTTYRTSSYVIVRAWVPSTVRPGRRLLRVSGYGPDGVRYCTTTRWVRVPR